MLLHTDAHADAVRRYYAQAEAELAGIIRDAVARGAKGTARYYAQQREAVQTILSALDSEGQRLAAEGVAQSYITGALVAERTLGIGGNFAGVHQDAIKVLIDNAVQPLGEATKMIGRRVDDIFRQTALHDVTLGILEGKTRKAVTRAYVNNLVREGITGFVDAGGRRWGLSSYAKMVARTTTREAVSHGTANRMLENGHDLVTISSHTHDQDVCTDYEGHTFSLSGDDAEFPELPVYPPFHPNCIHVLTPASATLRRFEQSVQEDAQVAKEPATVDPYALAAQSVRAVIDDFKVPSGRQHSIDSLAPNGLDDPELDVPWASDGETKRQRIQSIIADAKAADHAYLIRVGEALDEATEKIRLVEAERMNDTYQAARQLEADLDDKLYAMRRRELKANKEVSAMLRQIDDTPLPAREERLRLVAEKDKKHMERVKIRQEREALEVEWENAKRAMEEARKAATELAQHVRLELLRAMRPGYGTGQLDMGVDNLTLSLGINTERMTRFMHDSAVRFLPREWIERANKNFKVEVVASHDRAHYNKYDKQIVTKYGDNSTALHELAHHMEASYDSLLRAQYSYYNARTAGERLRKLNEIKPGYGYRDDEVVREDKFTNPYIGKDYGGSAFEMLSMGLEGVFYGRHNLGADREFGRWVLGMLATL